MTVTRIPGEFRYWVSSESRSGIDHLVDLTWQEERWNKPIAKCSCEACQAQGVRYCKHIKATVLWEMKRLGLWE